MSSSPESHRGSTLGLLRSTKSRTDSFHPFREIHEDPTLGEPCVDTTRRASGQPTPNPNSLSGTTTIIVGGSHGMALVLVLAVLEAGGCVVCVDKAEEPAPELWAQVHYRAETWHLSATYYQCDTSDESDFEQLLNRIATDYQLKSAPIRGLISCGAVMQRAPVLEYRSDDFAYVMARNVTTMFATAKQAAKLFQKTQEKGSIVLIASIAGHIAQRVSFTETVKITHSTNIGQGISSIAYNSSKAAIHQMCRCMAQEFGEHGVRINTLSPGYIRTKGLVDLFEREPKLKETWLQGAMLGRLMEPVELKAPTIFLLSEASSYITGTDLRVDGGQTASA